MGWRLAETSANCDCVGVGVGIAAAGGGVAAGALSLTAVSTVSAGCTGVFVTKTNSTGFPLSSGEVIRPGCSSAVAVTASADLFGSSFVGITAPVFFGSSGVLDDWLFGMLIKEA